MQSMVIKIVRPMLITVTSFRDDIDAVHIATPDHWHAQMTEGCRHGKDVFCQKLNLSLLVKVL